MTNKIKLPPLPLAYQAAYEIGKDMQAYATQAVAKAIAQRDADHLAELRAYELTVANLREQLAQRGEPVAWEWRFADGDLSESPFESRSECERDAVGYDGEAIPLYTHPQAPQVPMTLDSVIELVKECGLDWHRGFVPLFADDPTNRFAVLVEAVEAHHGIKEQP